MPSRNSYNELLGGRRGSQYQDIREKENCALRRYFRGCDIHLSITTARFLGLRFLVGERTNIYMLVNIILCIFNLKNKNSRQSTK